MKTKQFFIWLYSTLLIFFIAPNISFGANILTPKTIYNNTIVTCELDTDRMFTVYSVDTGEHRASETCANPSGDLSTVWGGDGVDYFPLTNYYVLVVDAIAISPDCFTSYDLCLLTGSVVSNLGIYSFFNTVAPSGLFHFKNPITNAPSDSPTDLLASVGIVSTDTFDSALPYMLVSIGTGLAFYLIQKLKDTLEIKEKKLLKKYLNEFEVIDGVEQHPSGYNYKQYKKRYKNKY